MPPCDLDEQWISLCGPGGGGMADCPEQEARDPQPQAKA
jgi:hypothetical protein